MKFNLVLPLELQDRLIYIGTLPSLTPQMVIPIKSHFYAIERFQDIEVNFKALYLKRFTNDKDKEGNDLGKMLSISLEHE
jgi:hypothetical protein